MGNRITSSGFRYVAYFLLIAALFVGGYFIGKAITSPQQAPTPTSAPSGAGIVNPPYQLQDFTLTDHHGEPIQLSDLRGKPVLMFFGYTHCPDVCPGTLAIYKRVKEALGNQADDVSFVMISVDGERDTPDVMAEYLSRFDPAFIGMTGTQEMLEQIGEEYGLVTERVSVQEVTENHADGHGQDHEEALDSDHYFVEHTSPSFLIDADGYLRLVYLYGAHPDSIATGIQSLLNG